MEPRTQCSAFRVDLTQALIVSNIDTASMISKDYNRAADMGRFAGFELTMPDAIEIRLGETISKAASQAWRVLVNGKLCVKRDARGWMDTNSKRLALDVRYTLVPSEPSEGERSHRQTQKYPFVAWQTKDNKWVWRLIPGRSVGDG